MNKFGLRIKVKGNDQYLSEDFSIVSENESAVVGYSQAVAIAQGKYGEDWKSHCEIIALTAEEWLRHITRKGGSRSTRAKKAAAKRREESKRRARQRRKRLRLERLQNEPKQKAKRGPKPRPGQWWHNGKITVRARSVGLANRYVRRIDPTLKRGQVRATWIQAKPVESLPEYDGVYQFDLNENSLHWKRLL